MRIIVKITIDDNRFMTIEAIPEVMSMIEKVFTFNDMSNCFLRGKFDRDNIVRRKFLITSTTNQTKALLPIGFKNDLEAWLIKNKATYKFIEQRKLDDFNFTDQQISDSLDYLKMHDYQIEAVQKCLTNKAGIIKSPTGSGKCVTGDAEIEIEYDEALFNF